MSEPSPVNRLHLLPSMLIGNVFVAVCVLYLSCAWGVSAIQLNIRTRVPAPQYLRTANPAQFYGHPGHSQYHQHHHHGHYSRHGPHSHHNVQASPPASAMSRSMQNYAKSSSMSFAPPSGLGDTVSSFEMPSSESELLASAAAQTQFLPFSGFDRSTFISANSMAFGPFADSVPVFIEDTTNTEPFPGKVLFAQSNGGGNGESTVSEIMEYEEPSSYSSGTIIGRPRATTGSRKRKHRISHKRRKSKRVYKDDYDYEFGEPGGESSSRSYSNRQTSRKRGVATRQRLNDAYYDVQPSDDSVNDLGEYVFDEEFVFNRRRRR